MLKLGYQISTAHPEEDELLRGQKMAPWMVLLRAPTDENDQQNCLDLVRRLFHERGTPIIACASTPEERGIILERLPKIQVLVGSPLRLNELHSCIQELLKMVKRRELRIKTEMIVAHREPDLYQDDFYFYDTLTSLSTGGCFVKTDDPYPAGSPVELILCLGGGSESVSIRGMVRRVTTEQEDGESGMGVQFGQMKSSAANALESFLLSQLGTLEFPSTL